MNDFTKDELIALKNGIEYLPERINLSKQSQDMCNGILIKIESMIDNYCDHPVCFIDYDYQATRCKKCLDIVE